MIIREITIDDARKYRIFRDQLDHETEFWGTESGERFGTSQEVIEHVTTFISKTHSTILLAEKSSQLIGFISAESTKWKSLQHTVLIMIGVLKDFHAQGVGIRLSQEVEQWAQRQRIHRLEALIMAHNHASLALCRKMGFEQEGIRRESSLINGKYVDEIWMAKLL